jgi:hypothetical protein
MEKKTNEVAPLSLHLDGINKTVRCPFRAAVEASGSSLVYDTVHKPAMQRLFGIGKIHPEVFMSEPALKELPSKEQLNVISALAIHHFTNYVRAHDKLIPHPPLSNLADILLEWEQTLLSQDSDVPAAAIVQIMDELWESASLPSNDIEAALEGTDFVRPSSIILLAGIQTLQDFTNRNMDAWPQDFIRFIGAVSKTHIIESRYQTIESAQQATLSEKIRFLGKRLAINIALKTHGVIPLKGRITPNGTPQKLYKRALEPRVGCALLLSGEIRFLAERELGFTDF